jgi:hypothetical protein
MRLRTKGLAALVLTLHEGHAEDGRACKEQQEGKAIPRPIHVHHVAHHHTRGCGMTAAAAAAAAMASWYSYKSTSLLSLCLHCGSA